MTEQDLKDKVIATLPAHIGFGGLLCQLNRDEGDTLQREGTAAVLLSVCGDEELSGQFSGSDACFKELETHPGWYRRSPDPAMPAFETDDRQTSRDQLSMAKAGMVAQGLTSRLLTVVGAQILRLTFHQNYWSGTGYQIPDVMSPQEAAIGLRGLIGPLSWIVNHVLDLSLLIDLAMRDPSSWDADNMRATNLMISNEKYPTLWSWLAMKLYLKTNFMAQLWNYHKDSDGNNGCECMYWLFRLAFLKRYGYQPSGAP